MKKIFCVLLVLFLPIIALAEESTEELLKELTKDIKPAPNLSSKQLEVLDNYSNLIAAKSIKCVVGDGITTTFDDVKPNTEHPSKFSNDRERSIVYFDSIDYAAQTARLIANNGAADVVAILNRSGVHFVEQTAVGNIILTTIFPIKRGDGFVVVTSRHIGNLIGNDLILSQFYGTCNIWE